MTRKEPTPVHLAAGDALIVVDVQNDFLPGGALAVPRGGEVIGPMNGYIERFEAHHLPVFATRDWHPPEHCSFVDRGGPWPPHCLRETLGARFAAELRLPEDARIVSKADTADRDAYSGFEGTDLDAQLKQLGVRRVFIGGLATDYCVLNGVMDALRLGYRTFLLVDASRAVEVAAGDGQRAIEAMEAAGATPLLLSDLG